MMMTAWPKLIWDFEESSQRKVRGIGIFLAIVGVCGSVAGYQQQGRLVTKEDLQPLATKDDLQTAVKTLAGSGNKAHFSANPNNSTAATATSSHPERAWVELSAISSRLDIGSPASIEVTFRNTGKSAARKVRVRARMEGFAASTIPESAEDPPLVQGIGIMPPNGILRTTITPTDGSNLQSTTLDLVRSGQLHVFVYGGAEYEDEFADKHWMKYCYLLEKNATSWVLCDTRNDVDSISVNRR